LVIIRLITTFASCIAEAIVPPLQIGLGKKNYNKNSEERFEHEACYYYSFDGFAPTKQRRNCQLPMSRRKIEFRNERAKKESTLPTN
jgi:hypothetical protein